MGQKELPAQVGETNAQDSQKVLSPVELEREVRARVGNKEILLLDVKARRCRLAMTAKAFRAFKIKAAKDEVLRHFEFSHRNPKTQRRAEQWGGFQQNNRPGDPKSD